MSDHPVIPIAPAALESLMYNLEVKFVALSECLVSPGFVLDMGGIDTPGIHYNLSGHGVMVLADGRRIGLKPDTLIIVPANSPFRIEVADPSRPDAPMQVVDGRLQAKGKNMLRRFSAGQGAPEIVLICGFFHASYGTSTDLFATLVTPIIEQFKKQDQLDHVLLSALRELNDQRVGSGAMSAALLKQVIIAILRRSLHSVDLWVERFSILSDPPIALAFSQMVAHPGGPHTVNSLAKTVHLSRSSFMARFTGLFGHPPMTVLRSLRMRQAVQLLQAGGTTIDKVARAVGYDSRSSFVRAFRSVHKQDPSDLR